MREVADVASARRIAGAVVLALLGSSGCMSSPTDGQTMSKPTDTLAFGGYVPKPSDKIDFQIQNQSTGDWKTLSSTTTSTSGTADGAGVTWYTYSGSTVLPFTPSYWTEPKKSGTQRRIRADVQSYSATYGAMYSFTDEGITCAQQQSSGLDAAGNCHSGNSPEAHLFANCGKADQVCCIATNTTTLKSCDSGRRCDTSKKTCSIIAGGFQQPCNGDGSCGSASLTCAQDHCWTLLENAPVTKLQLRTHTTTGSSDGTNDGVFLTLKGADFGLDNPGDDRKVGGTDLYNISLSDIDTVGDISQLKLKITGNDGWKFDQLDLLVNGQTILQWRGTATIDTDGSDTFTLSASTLRASSLWQPGDQACDAPTRITAADIQKKVQGLLGDEFARSGSTSWGDSGYVKVSGRGPSSIWLDMKFFGSSPLGDADITTRASLTVSCDQTFQQVCDSSGTCQKAEFGTPNKAIVVGTPTVTGVDGDLWFQFIDLITAGGMTETVKDIVMSKGGLILSFGAGDDLPVCLDTTFDSSANLNIDWNVDKSWFLGGPHSTFNLASVDKLLCQSNLPF